MSDLEKAASTEKLGEFNEEEKCRCVEKALHIRCVWREHTEGDCMQTKETK